MIRLPALFWFIVVVSTGFAMFAVKYEVQSLSDELTRTLRQTDDTERSVRVLDAEWAYLNRPDALAQMNQRFLSLVPIATKQLRSDFSDIPMRPAPPPPPAPPAPAMLVADTQAAAPDAPTEAAPTPSGPAEAALASGSPVGLGVAKAAAAPSPERVAAQPPEHREPAPRLAPPERGKPVLTAALDAPPPTARAIRTAAAKAGHSAPRRAASLNELIAQIVESR